jgi:tRNA (cytidine56-2'-O)-methyltransferase
VARAFGASEIIYSGQRDDGIEETVSAVCREWGGSFSVKFERDWKKVLKNFRGKKAHLTMYGIPFSQKLQELRNCENLLVVIGGAKVPSEVYQLCDFNLSVTTQPHSEVAALAVLLHDLFEGKEPESNGGKRTIIPQERGKKVIEANKGT